MREPRFPPLTSPPSIVAAVFTVLVVLAGLFVLGNVSPFWLIMRDGASSLPAVALVLVITLSAVFIYLFTAPRMWALAKRYTPEQQGQRQLPGHLVASCLEEMDFACPTCAYNLRGLRQPNCPECNAPVVVYLYGQRPPSAKWNGLVICWLVLTLVTSATIVGGIWYRMSRSYYYGSGGARELTMYLLLLAGGFATVVCAWRAVALAVPKPPHKQSLCVRRTVLWLAVASGCVTTAIGCLMGYELLRDWY